MRGVASGLRNFFVVLRPQFCLLSVVKAQPQKSPMEMLAVMVEPLSVRANVAGQRVPVNACLVVSSFRFVHIPQQDSARSVELAT